MSKLMRLLEEIVDTLRNHQEYVLALEKRLKELERKVR